MLEFQCARATVDRAVNSLIEDGVLEGKKGSGTYVVDKPKQRRIKRMVYVVLHRETELCEADLYPFFDCLRGNYKKRNNLVFITINELQMKPESYLENGQSFIFCQLNPKYLGIMDKLKEKQCNILLINRQDPNFDYITNDCLDSLVKAFTPFKGKKIGVIAEPPCLELPYRMEYAAACFQAISCCKLETKKEWYIECDIQNSGAGMRSLIELFAREEKPEIIFLLAYTLPYVISAMHVNNLVPGEDIKLIHFDAMPETVNNPGVITLQQDFLAMGQETLKWLELVHSVESKSEKFQKFIIANSI